MTRENLTKIPRPGEPVRGSRTGQPIMVLFDLLGRRWALGILWNLSSEALTFRELQSRCDTVSPTVLNTRLKELRTAGLVEKAEGGYVLTASGTELFQKLKPLGEWAADWTRTL